MKPYVDVGKVIHEPSATISEGAIVGWDINNKYHYHLLRCLSNHYNFSLDEPFDQLSEEIKELILEGSKGEPVDFSWRSKRGKLVERIYSFEGVMTNINRRYKETDSNGVRDYLSKLISLRNCQSCSGTRLREEARNVFVANNSLPNITALTIDEAFEFFSNLKS